MTPKVLVNGLCAEICGTINAELIPQEFGWRPHERRDIGAPNYTHRAYDMLGTMDATA